MRKGKVIPYVDHRTPPDVTVENYRCYVRLLKEYVTLASIFRQGIIFIPAVFIMKAIIGVDGLIWAQPVADVLSLVIIMFMSLYKIRKTDFSKTDTVDR